MSNGDHPDKGNFSMLGAHERYLVFRGRLKAFALRVIRLYAALPVRGEAQVLGRQLLRSGTSVGAQYCEGYRAKSRADFISKNEGAMQELEESLFWMELLVEAGIVDRARMEPLLRETQELLSIFVSMIRTAKKRRP